MLEAEPFWDKLSRRGIRVGILDVPLLPLVKNLNGFQVCEWGSHDTFLGGLETWPPNLAGEIIEQYGNDPVGTCDDIVRTPDGYADFVSNLEARISIRERILSDLCNRFNPDFLFTVFSESHCVGHQAWHLHDAGHPLFDARTVSRIQDPLLRVYRAIDTSLQRVIDFWPDAHLLVLLSHGMGPHYGISYMFNALLQKLDGQQVAATERYWPRVQRAWQRTPEWLKHLLPDTQAWRLSLKTALSAHGRSQQRFFAVTNNDVFGAVRINLHGREPSGTVTKDEYPSLIRWLEQQLLSLRCSRTGQRVALEVVRSADIYDGPFAGDLPDLMVKWNQEVPINRVILPSGEELAIPYQGIRTGDHRGDGLGRLYLYHRNTLLRDERAAIRNIDIAPTIATLLNIDSSDFAGTPAHGI
jgi:predicted AlkP superfamily phosphohydrolase/phosphomutase